ncbi:general substrate transporter, partial [Mycena epipterygia]
VNFCWALGQVVGIGVTKSMLPRTDQWAYRIPYALQWIWPVLLLTGVALAPESPWWLVRRGRLDDAKHVLLRLMSLDRETDFYAHETIAMMRHDDGFEADRGAPFLFHSLSYPYSPLSSPPIVCMVWAMQNLAGNSFTGYSTYFLEQAGLAPAKSYDFALGQYGINMAGVLGARALMAR